MAADTHVWRGIDGAPGQAAASVGINGDLTTAGTMDIHGSLIVAGESPLPITSGHYHVDGNFKTNADLSATGADISFGRDLWVNGAITAIGLVSVDGDVYQSPGHEGADGLSVGGDLFSQDFSIPEPCACAEADLLDIDAIVAEGLARSHNAEAGVDADDLTQVGSGPLVLECGRFAFPGGSIVGNTTIEVAGRTALFIDGDLEITGNFGVDLGAEGELDVFVTGNLILTGSAVVGSVERPAALRFYVGGEQDVSITGAMIFAANLYAPRATLIVSGAEHVYGSYFVGDFAAVGVQVMHYDSAVLEDGEDCDDPPPDDGCEEDRQCREPTVCDANGRCTPLVTGPD